MAFKWPLLCTPCQPVFGDLALADTINQTPFEQVQQVTAGGAPRGFGQVLVNRVVQPGIVFQKQHGQHLTFVQAKLLALGLGKRILPEDQPEVAFVFNEMPPSAPTDGGCNEPLGSSLDFDGHANLFHQRLLPHNRMCFKRVRGSRGFGGGADSTPDRV